MGTESANAGSASDKGGADLLERPVSSIVPLPPVRVRVLERTGIATVGALLRHYPRRYEDRRTFDPFPSHESERPLCVLGVITNMQLRRVRGRQRMFDVTLQEESPSALSVPLLLRWFNAFWVEKAVAVGQRLIAFGKPRQTGKQLVMAHPEFEVMDEAERGNVHLRRIVPIHPATEGLTPRLVREIIWALLEAGCADAFETNLPQELRATGLSSSAAVRAIHFPETYEDLELARCHLVLEEFFTMQLNIARRRLDARGNSGERHVNPEGTLVRDLHAALPFPLTAAQRRCLTEIASDMAASRPMNRLLHGDVGSGKTVVALSAMLHAVDAGYQAALMAPTQILAEQHFLNFHNLLAPLGVAVALRTGARDENPGSKAVGQPDLFDDGKQRLPQIVVGTHALLFEEGLFDRLGLVVIDEQHKFGVLQRASLRRQGPSADVLVMTATPIPRTLTMTLYGDLDVSVLDELPKGRQKVVTVARPRTKLPEATKFIREHLDKGRQAYIVYPLIEGSERSEAKAAKEEHGRWTEALHPHRCALIHGRIRPEEKEQIMTDFRDAKVKVLVATSVIEVGIDVPNANIILIENAERFGLAQLHQLRGRVGRGAHKSYCVLLTESGDADDLEKLRVLERTANGFEIAEADLELRGPGDLLGTAQSGASPLRLGNPVRDLALMQEARDAAFALLERDPDCQLPENSRFAQFLQTAVPTETPSLDLSQVS